MVADFAREAASYTNYTPGAGVPGGAQGFPGFQPRSVVHANRHKVGVYAAEPDTTKAWLVEGAVRYEHYPAFGSNATGKVATRLKLSGNFALRGTLSTGFRAPCWPRLTSKSCLAAW